MKDQPEKKAAYPKAHLDARTEELRDHLRHDHKVSVEMMVGLNRWALLDLHTEKHNG